MAIAANFLKQIRLTEIGNVGTQFSGNLVSATSTSGNITLPKASNINVEGAPRIPATPTSNLTYAPRQERASVTEPFRRSTLQAKQQVSFAEGLPGFAEVGKDIARQNFGGKFFADSARTTRNKAADSKRQGVAEAASGGFIKRKKVK
tara:strand:+ start:630 stop:1073 length:444 start_codon:yes stop_codon:yes gene_type:complete